MSARTNVVEVKLQHAIADYRLLRDLFPEMVKHDTDIMKEGGEHK